MPEKATQEQIAVPLVYDVPPDMPAGFVTNMVVQHTPQEFIVSFFEVQPPILLGTPEENRVALSQMKSMTARCIGRYVISPDRMREFVEVLKRNLEAYTAAAAKEKG